MKYYIQNKQAVIDILKKHLSPKMGGVYAWISQDIDDTIEELNDETVKSVEIEELLKKLKSRFKFHYNDNYKNDYPIKTFESIQKDLYNLTGCITRENEDSFTYVTGEIDKMIKEELEKNK